MRLFDLEQIREEATDAIVFDDDYEDAIKILGWDLDEYGVGKSSNGSRMNEVKCHLRWADRIYKLGQVYGIQEG